MASGDRIFIADKPTLDLIKTATDRIDNTVQVNKTYAVALSSQVSDVKDSVSSVASKVSTIGDSVAELKESIASPAPINSFRNLRYVNTTIPVGTGYSTMISVTTPGTLYLATILCMYASASNATNQTHMQILVDGTIIYDGGLILASSYTYNVGYASAPVIVGSSGNSGMLLLDGSVLSTDRGNALFLGSPTYTPCMTSIRPIKWNSSLLIRAYNTQNTGNFHGLYELD